MLYGARVLELAKGKFSVKPTSDKELVVAMESFAQRPSPVIVTSCPIAVIGRTEVSLPVTQV